MAQLPAEIRSLLQALTKRNALDLKLPLPAQIKRLVEGSGLFLEAKLAQGKPPGADIKADLLKLMAMLQPSLPKTGQALAQIKQEQAMVSQAWALELADQVEAALAQVKTHQLASLRQDAQASPEWRLEIPLQWRDQCDDLELAVRQQPAAEAGAEAGWAARLEFDFPELGAVSVGIQLIGKQVHCVFSTERGSTNQQIQQQLPWLEHSLRQAELEPASLHCHQNPEQAKQLSVPNLGIQLLDEQA